MLRICQAFVTHFSDMLRICQAFVTHFSDMLRICQAFVTHFCNMLRTCQALVTHFCNMLRTCQALVTHFCNMLRTCQALVTHFFLNVIRCIETLIALRLGFFMDNKKTIQFLKRGEIQHLLRCSNSKAHRIRSAIKKKKKYPEHVKFITIPDFCEHRNITQSILESFLMLRSESWAHSSEPWIFGPGF
jgi:hypothetical protein